MSNIYIQEPPTNGKVLLKTTLGEIDIELWSKEAPMACRNFVQLCMERYYDETIFHRVVKGFIAQGGDPSGTGTGGESIYGKPFKDEFHQRLKFNRRGLVAMANAGKDDNGSQFFFTLDRAEELQKKHTIFGKVTGNTIYNMIRFNDLEVDHDDRPTSPPKVIKTEILSNPFDDIEPRLEKKNKDGASEKSGSKIKSKSKATKNYKLLSFGEEAEEDEEEEDNLVKELKIKSSHDALSDPKLSAKPALNEDDMKRKNPDDDELAESIRKKLKKREQIEREQKSQSEDEEENKNQKKAERRKALQDEAKKLKKELKRKDVPKEQQNVEEGNVDKQEKEPINDLMKEIVAERNVFHKKKKEDTMLKKGGGRESQTLALLAGFESRLNSFLETEEGDEEKDSDSDWMTHKLQFEENTESGAKDANMKGDDWYDIYDPRNPLNKRRREKKKDGGGGGESSKSSNSSRR